VLWVELSAYDVKSTKVQHLWDLWLNGVGQHTHSVQKNSVDTLLL